MLKLIIVILRIKTFKLKEHNTLVLEMSKNFTKTQTARQATEALTLLKLVREAAVLLN
ncbi:hypothetical protein SBDP2_630003 [Syntrophobacter sp. SbD2]|nr:hypothetical protein SBDP2_630003 [Syntrophobacter sp. SbD2]